jgi:hypothetical protein
MPCARTQRSERLPLELLSVDGVALDPPAFGVASPVFSFTMPRTDNFLQVAGQTHGRSAVFGAAAILRPLKLGHHTLVASFDVLNASRPAGTYELTVSERSTVARRRSTIRSGHGRGRPGSSVVDSSRPGLEDRGPASSSASMLDNDAYVP